MFLLVCTEAVPSYRYRRGKDPLNDIESRELIRMQSLEFTAQEVTFSGKLSLFSSSWFSTAKSTEAMMRETEGESAAFAELSAKPFVNNL